MTQKGKKKPTNRGKRRVNGLNTSTAASRIIDAHYEAAGVRKVWTLERINRLARALNLTFYEVASLLGMPHTAFKTFAEKRQLGGPTCVLLTLIERTMLSGVYNDTIDLFNFETHGRPKDPKGKELHPSEA